MKQYERYIKLVEYRYSRLSHSDEIKFKQTSRDNIYCTEIQFFIAVSVLSTGTANTLKVLTLSDYIDCESTLLSYSIATASRLPFLHIFYFCSNFLTKF